MHPSFEKADKLSRDVIGGAIEVHRVLGPGLIESIHERCLMRELELRRLTAVNQRLVKIEYKGMIFEEPLRFDILVEDCLLLELKCVQKILPPGTNIELHEVAERPTWPDLQFPRTQTDRRGRAVDPSYRQSRMTKKKFLHQGNGANED